MLLSRYVEELQLPLASEKDQDELQRTKVWYEACIKAWKDLFTVRQLHRHGCVTCAVFAAQCARALRPSNSNCLLVQQQYRLGREIFRQYHVLSECHYRKQRHIRNHTKQESMLEGSQ